MPVNEIFVPSSDTKNWENVWVPIITIEHLYHPLPTAVIAEDVGATPIFAETAPVERLNITPAFVPLEYKPTKFAVPAFA